MTVLGLKKKIDISTVMSRNSPAFHDKYRDIMVITWETDVVPRDLIWEDKQEGTSKK